MTFGQHEIGVAVIATGDVEQAARTAGSLDLCAGALFLRRRLLVARVAPTDSLTLPDSWEVLRVPPDDTTPLAEIAVAQAQNCDWLAVVEGNGKHIPSGFVNDLVVRVGRGAAGPDLRRVGAEGAAAVPLSAMEHPERLAEMLGVTIVTPKYEALAAEAVRRFKRFTGLPVMRIEVAEGEGFAAKLRLADLCPARRVVFFDADWWLLRAVDVTALEGDFCAVPDPSAVDMESFCAVDARALALPAAEYFNSGFMVADFTLERVRAMFRTARLSRDLADHTDQSYLNRARMAQGVPLTRLPLEWNYYHRAATWGCVKAIPPHLLAVHAAGVPLEEKPVHLEGMVTIFSTGVTRAPRAPVKRQCTRTASDWLAEKKMDWSQWFAPGNHRDVKEAVKMEVARALLADTDLRHWKTRASARCYLTYRHLQGTLERAVYDAEVRHTQVVMDEEDDMSVRWWISQQTADIYVAYFENCFERAEALSLALLHRAWNPDYLNRWQPMLANVLRVTCLLAYLHFLRGREREAAQLVGNMVDTWQQQTRDHNWTRWPLRFQEAQSDLHALQNAMYIARATGLTEFEDQDWLARRGRNDERGNHFNPYARIMRALGAKINAERDLFA